MMALVIFLATLLAVYGIALGIVVLAKKGMPWRYKYRSPFTSDFLRGPGQSVYEKVEDLRFDILTDIFCMTMLPPIMASILFIQAGMAGKQPGIGVVTMCLALGLAVIVWLGLRLYRRVRNLRQYRLGYEGEVAVGQELSQLMFNGFHIFHDLPADGFNIDHIVVGSTGVFAVETKARSKPDSGNRKSDGGPNIIIPPSKGLILIVE